MIAESFLEVYHLEIFRRDSRRKLVFGNGEPRLFLDMVCYNICIDISYIGERYELITIHTVQKYEFYRYAKYPTFQFKHGAG